MGLTPIVILLFPFCGFATGSLCTGAFWSIFAVKAQMNCFYLELCSALAKLTISDELTDNAVLNLKLT